MNKKKHKSDLNEDLNLRDSAPELSRIKKENPYEVPDGYFDTLHVSIQERIKEKTGWNPARLLGYFFRRPVRLVLVTVLFTGIVLAFFVFRTSENNNNMLYVDMTWEELIYSDPGLIYNIDDETIVELYVAAEGSEVDLDTYETGILNDTNITEEMILDYLNDQDISTELIYEL
ncbi:MAG: hypothetical protein K8R53_11120 [Bacteroidales bacterium]|nr:hypothetical protein [Bacteroidales bacterium]